MIGRTVSHYKILEKLGEGGMGVVYKAQDTKLGRLVALKFLPSEYTSDPQAKQRFINEAKAASALDHPNICTVYEIGETPDGQTFIAMACYEGETLQQEIARGQLSIDDCVHFAIEIAEGLHAAHKKGIIHRDIKSSNIMVTSEGQVKIMDFGLAKTSAGTMLTKTGATVGTVPYMSPEQARGEKVDHRTDIWSLGVVLYEMITGRLPFESPYTEAVVYSILNEEPKPFSLVRSDVPAEVENIVKKCLQKNPANRYQHADELIADLRRAKTQAVREVPTEEVPTPKKLRWRNWYLIGGAGLVLALLLYVVLPLPTTEDENIRSIAVLPLDNLSRDPDQEYFADGMTEALITELSKISALKVISRTSAMQYKGVKKTIPQIARELDVEGIIEGSVLREGGRIRITVQLIHGATDRHLWAQNFDRELRSILALHSDVAQAIATEIHVTLTPGERARASHGRAVNPDAHDAYVRGRYYWNQRTPDGFQKAAEYFQRALDLDPNYALAYAGVADNYLQQVIWGILSPEDGYPRVKAAATRALEIDSSLAEPHVTLGYVLRDYDWDWEGAERAFHRALELQPNYPTGHHWYAYHLSSLGRHDAAISEIKRARELDPLSVIINSNVGRILYYARRYDEAESAVRKALEMNANFAEAHANLGLIYLATGRAREAAASLARAAELYPARPEYRSALAEAYVLTGQRQQARRLLEQLEKEFRDRYVPAGQIALVYGRLGEKDRVAQWLDECLRQRDWWRGLMNVAPRFDFLRDNPRFQALLRRMNFPTFESNKVGSLAPTKRRTTEIPAEWHASIAVLPFKNISPDKEQEYFCDGMTEAIITDLAKIGELIVMSPAAVSRYKGTSTNPIEIGRELKVQYLVEGSVQRMGTALRVSAQLTNTETGAQVWADRFDRTTREVFKVQDDVSRRIVGALQLKVGLKAERSRPAQNFDAYDTFLRGRFYLRKQSVKEVDRAVALFEQAVQLDPNYAPALASLGMAYIQKSFYDEPLKREWEEKAFIIIEKALRIDPNLAEAYVAKGNLLWTPVNRFPHEKAIAAYRRAIELNPNLDEAHEWLGLVYYHVGLMEAGLEECREALQINPSSGFAQSRLGINLLYSGRYEEALSELRKVPKDFNPQIVSAQIGLTLSYLGRMKEAKAVIEEGQKQLPDDPFLLSAQALLFAKEGRPDEAIHKIRQAEKREKTYLGHFHHAAYNIGSAYALMRQNSLAVEWLRKAAENGFPCYPKYEQDQNLNTLRQDPIFTIFMNDLRKQWEKYKTLIR